MTSIGFRLFDPLTDKPEILPDAAGVYLIVLRPTATLPIMTKNLEMPLMSDFSFNGEVYKVIYAGKSSKSLHARDYAQHFNGTAGRSTLRKSIGCLMGYKLIPRDANAPLNGKTTFNVEDENNLTEWMVNNLLLFYSVTNDFTNLEKELIKEYNPPLNLQGNFYKVNFNFRKKLSLLRKYSTDLSTSYRHEHDIRDGLDNVPIYSYCPLCGEVLWDNKPYCFICGWKA